MVVGDVLTVNAGSSSLKVHVIEHDTVHHQAEIEHPPDSEDAYRALDDLIDKAGDIDRVAHRLVHGGPDIRVPTVVTDDSLAAARKAESLAPLHVPPALRLVDHLRGRLPDIPHVLCPDTAFHADLPEVAATYPLPKRWRDEYGLRRYGFHGLSYQWATTRTAELLGRSDVDIVIAHLGGGCSVCAVHHGKSVDTSMGFTPLEGLAMSTRSGSVDPGMLLWLLRRVGADALENALNHESGLLGLSDGLSNDTRDLVKAANGGNQAAALALRVFAHRARREMAAAATSLPRLDAIVFTGEIGWDQPEVRREITAGLGPLGVPTAPETSPTVDGVISPPDAAVAVLVVQPREELQLARDALSAAT